MTKIFFNKLARDKIPQNIAAKGVAFETRQLSKEEFGDALLKKVYEEAEEVAKSVSREELVAEIADLEDALEALKKCKGIEETELARAKAAAFEKKGGFDDQVFLIWTEDDGYRSTK